MEKQTTGAWVVHHGRKVAADMRGAAEFSAIDLAAKSAGLLSRLGQQLELQACVRHVRAGAGATVSSRRGAGGI